MHICWRVLKSNGYTSWQRIQFVNSTEFTLTLINITADRRLLPKISSFSHPHYSAVSVNEEVWFQIETDGITMRYF